MSKPCCTTWALCVVSWGVWALATGSWALARGRSSLQGPCSHCGGAVVAPMQICRATVGVDAMPTYNVHLCERLHRRHPIVSPAAACTNAHPAAQSAGTSITTAIAHVFCPPAVPLAAYSHTATAAYPTSPHKQRANVTPVHKDATLHAHT